MTPPRHIPMTGWAVTGDCLLVGGIPITRLADRAGGTPFYAYDRSLIDRRVEALRRWLPPAVRLHYAVKANPMPALVCHMAGLVDGFDVASGGELSIALDSGMSVKHVSFAGPGKREAELAQAIAAGALVSIESPREVEILERLCLNAELTARVAVRINPDFELRSSGMKMGGGPRQFGIDAEAVPQLLKEIERRGLQFEGFHIFSGSQNLNARAICDSQQKAVELALQLAESAPSAPRTLNIGGGFGIPYFPGDEPLDVRPIGENLHALAARVDSQVPGAALVIELGRYLVGEAGIYVCRVIDRKISRGEVFLVTDGGMHHHLAASGNFGQVFRKNYPAAIGNHMRSASRELASVVGPLCTPLDMLADRMELAVAHEGDLVVVFQSGAYGLTASPTQFLSHPSAREILV